MSVLFSWARWLRPLRVLARRAWPRLAGASMLGAALMDEFTSAFIVVQLPAIQENFRLSYTQTELVLTVTALTGMVIEPPLLASADRGDKRRWMIVAAVILAACYVTTGLSQGYLWLLVAVGVLGPASGIVCGCGQAGLIDRNPTRTALVMTPWTLLGTVGDLAGPLTIAALAACGWSWRAILMAGGAAWLVYALWVGRRTIPRPPRSATPAISEEGNHGAGFWTNLRQAARVPQLWCWAFLLELVCLLDEVLVALASLYMHRELGMSQSQIALAIAIACGIGVAWLPVLERLLTRASRSSLLRFSSVVTLAGLALFLHVHRPFLMYIAVAVIGAGAVDLYPILKAQAYDALPGRSGTMLALLGLLSPISMVQPWLLGWVADQAGLAAAVALTSVCPLAVLLLTPGDRQVAGRCRSGLRSALPVSY